MALLLYFLRDPVYASVTQPATGKVRPCACVLHSSSSRPLTEHTRSCACVCLPGVRRARLRPSRRSRRALRVDCRDELLPPVPLLHVCVVDDDDDCKSAKHPRALAACSVRSSVSRSTAPLSIDLSMDTVLCACESTIQSVVLCFSTSSLSTCSLYSRTCPSVVTCT